MISLLSVTSMIDSCQMKLEYHNNTLSLIEVDEDISITYCMTGIITSNDSIVMQRFFVGDHIIYLASRNEETIDVKMRLRMLYSEYENIDHWIESTLSYNIRDELHRSLNVRESYTSIIPNLNCIDSSSLLFSSS